MSGSKPLISDPQQRQPGSDKRCHSVRLFLSDGELACLRRIADASGLSPQMVLRKLIFSCPVARKPEPEFLELLSAVERLECDLNMIAWSASGSREDPGISEAVRIMREIRNETERWKQRWL
jgi:hypothetical protein